MLGHVYLHGDLHELAGGVGAHCDLSVLCLQVHEKIRENPLPQPKERQKFPSQPKRKQQKLTYDERKQKLKVGSDLPPG